MKELFEKASYDRTFTVTRDEVRTIPKQLVDMIVPKGLESGAPG